MALTQQQLNDLAAELQRELSSAGESIPGTIKPDYVALAGAVDAWVESFQASYNSALPLVFRNNATPAQKVRFLYDDLRKRFGG